MLCVAKVNLSDWPEGDRRDVDPASDRIVGLLRGGYIVPLVLPRRQPEPEPEVLGPDTALSPEGVVEEKPKRANRKRSE